MSTLWVVSLSHLTEYVAHVWGFLLLPAYKIGETLSHVNYIISYCRYRSLLLVLSSGDQGIYFDIELLILMLWICLIFSLIFWYSCWCTFSWYSCCSLDIRDDVLLRVCYWYYWYSIDVHDILFILLIFCWHSWYFIDILLILLIFCWFSLYSVATVDMLLILLIFFWYYWYSFDTMIFFWYYWYSFDTIDILLIPVIFLILFWYSIRWLFLNLTIHDIGLNI